MARGDLTQAHAILPLRRLMGEYGYDFPAEGSGKSSDLPCPFCQKKKASFRPGDEGAELFKCWNSECPSDTHRDGGSWAPVSFLAWQLKISWKEAFVAYMKQAGLFQEQAPVRIMPGVGSRKFKAPTPDLDSMPPEEREKVLAAQKDEEERRKRSAEAISAAEAPASAESEGDSEPPPEVLAASAEALSVLEATAKENQVDLPPEGADSNGSEAEEEDPEWRIALEEFYDRLSLTEEDAQKVWKKRGLPRDASWAYGLKSSGPENRAIIEDLRQSYPDAVLLEAGLLTKNKDTGELYPEPQLCGLGQTGKKTPDGEMAMDFGVNPILIPYFDKDDRLIALRPHKGGLPGRPARLYVARFRKISPKRVDVESHRDALITEGEFKAMAFHWAMEGKVGAAALPGISQAKNHVVRQDYKTFLEEAKVVRVVVCFDNEDKGNPALPGFKADETKRYEADRWARYLAICLQSAGYESRLAVLPNKWRDENGKADWDGAMARFVGEKTAADGLAGPSDSIWEKCAPVVRGLFGEVLKSAVAPSKASDVSGYTESAEKLIKGLVDRLFYVPKIPFGDSKEFAIIKRLGQLARKPKFKKHRFEMEAMAEAYKEVLGGYYTLRPLKAEAKLEAALVLQAKARKEQDKEMEWWLDLKIAGHPHWITNFRIVPNYRLRTADDQTIIMCELRNKLGERTGQVELPSDSIAAPNDWRKWIGRQRGSYVWFAGQNELDSLKVDLGHDMTGRDVEQVAAIGQDPSGVWFFSDCAIAPTGEIIRKDSEGVFWWGGKGYMVMSYAKDKQEFRMPPPKMRPDEWLGIDEHGEFCPAPTSVEKKGHAAAVRMLFQNFATACEETVGGYEGILSIGSVLAFAMAGDLFAKNGNFPCLWVHGETRQGKTTLVSWLMETWGFRNMSSGIGLGKSSTPVGIQIVMEQYSNLPIWLDEFRASECDPMKRSTLHSAFNREPATKHAADGRMRKVRTSLVVSGESTSDDPATRSRYAHVQVAASRRRGNFFLAVQGFRKFLFHLGREALLHRGVFVDLMQKRLDEWDSCPEVANEDARSRIIHGAGYAAFCAMSDMLGGAFPEAKLAEFRQFLFQHSRVSVEQNKEQINVQRFLSDVLTAVRLGVFGHTVNEVKRFFGVVGEERDHPPGASLEQGFWTSYRVYLEPNGIIAKMKEYLGKQREQMVLSRSDLRDQMSSKPWWHPMNENKPKWRFEGGKLTAWVIDLDHFPELGYRPVADEALAESRRSESGLAVTSDKFLDPRKGEFYALVERLLSTPTDPQ